LSTGGKVGIGVGAAAGLVLFLIILRTLFLARKSRHDRLSQQSAAPLHGQYQQSPPMTHYSQTSSVPYYSQSPPMSHYSGGPPPGHDPHWAPYPMQVDSTGKPIYATSVSPPVELSVDSQTNVHEMGSDVHSVSPPPSWPPHERIH
jgi:hypothetical protein